MSEMGSRFRKHFGETRQIFPGTSSVPSGFGFLVFLGIGGGVFRAVLSCRQR